MRTLVVSRQGNSYLIPNHDPNIQNTIRDEVVVHRSVSWELFLHWTVTVSSAQYAERTQSGMLEGMFFYHTKAEALSAARNIARARQFPLYIVSE